MRTAVRLTVATVSVLAIAAFAASRAGERGVVRPDVPTARPIRVLPPDSVIAGPVDTQATVGAYTLRILRDTAAGDQIVDIALRGHRVFAVRAFGARLELVGRDLTGDRSPDVVVRQYSGGMHCCSQATVLGLGPTLINYGTIDGADGDIEFDDIDNDGVMEAKVNDFRFAYWRDYAFVETQAPDVILRFRAGGYQPACDLMHEDPPDNATLNRRARELTDGWHAGNPPAEFWGYAVDLIYDGQADLAWRWLDRAWPRAIGGKDEFMKDLREKLRGSPCWSPPPGDRMVG
jgi:hypothetical protein